MRNLRLTGPGLLALVLLLPACTTQNPDGSDGPASAVTQESPPWQSTWELVKAELKREGTPSAVRIMHRGAYLSVAAICVEGTLPPPIRQAAEVLIVVEGKGTLETRGAEHPLTAGSIAVMPAGQRGPIHAPDGGFYALVIRSLNAKAATGEVSVAGVDEVLPASLIDNPGGNHAHTVGSVSGGLTVRTLSISGTVGRHVHLAHDEFVFLIGGWGTMGLGSEGSARHFMSYPLRERSMALIPAHSPHGYSNESDRTLAISISGPSLEAGAEDSFPIGERGEIGRSAAFRPAREESSTAGLSRGR